jgi:beta-glucosidase
MSDHKNPSLAPARRAAALLGLMTTDEKLAQLGSVIFPWGKFPVSLENGRLVKNADYTARTRHGIGSIAYVNMSLGVRDSVAFCNALQKDSLENTRLGIPVFILEECCHGQLAQESTVLPLPPGLAATFNPALVEAGFAMIGRECRVRGGNLALSPNLDTGRDPRWGRVEETFGEDTFLNSRMGVAAVRGLQGAGDLPRHVAACPKHFAGFAQSAGGRQHGAAEIPERLFRDEILPAFRAAVTEGGARCIMPSYTETDGVPCHGNRWLLDQVLRREWGFTGIVGADFGGVGHLHNRYRTAADDAEAGAQALLAGVDIDWPEGTCFLALRARLDHDRTLRDQVDTAVLRVLQLKFELGLFEHPYTDEAAALATVHNDHARALAQRCAEESLILLKNDGQLLPLRKDAPRRIALMGPHSRYLQFGGVSPHNRGTSVLQGLQDYLAGTPVELTWTQGCAMTDSDEELVYLKDTADRDFTSLTNAAFGLSSIEIIDHHKTAATIPLATEEPVLDLAVRQAAAADLVILCLGESSSITGEAVTPEARKDRDTLDLVGNQLELLRRVKALGKPVIVILIHGRALILDPVLALADAVIDAWNPGEARGQALARTLFGDHNPAGRLPVTLPRSVGQLPVHYSQKASAWLKPYALTEGRAGLPFGFGLSYTTFAYESLRLSADQIQAGETLDVWVTIKNTGPRDGDEVVQLYVHDEIASVSRPMWLLKAFARVTLRAGETREVHLSLPPSAFAFHNADMVEQIEPGWFTLAIGPDSATQPLTTRLQILDHQ